MVKFYMCDRTAEQWCYAVNEEELLGALEYASNVVRAFPKVYTVLMEVGARYLEEENWEEEYVIAPGKVECVDHIRIGYAAEGGREFFYANISDYYTNYIKVDEFRKRLAAVGRKR